MGFAYENSGTPKDETMGKMGTFIVFIAGVSWVPEELRERNQVSNRLW